MKPILKFFSILLIRYLQRRYKKLSLSSKFRQSNRALAILMLIQSVLYYFKQQFNAWGYFHPSCVWSKEDDLAYNKLFPQKDFEELKLIIEYNPEAITYYKNKIFTLTKGNPPNYANEIKKQLIKWNSWN